MPDQPTAAFASDSASDSDSDDEVMADWMRGAMFTQVLAASVRLGVVDLVDRDRPTVEELVADLRLGARPARTFVALLVAMRILATDAGGRLHLTARGRHLHPASGDLRGQVLLAGGCYYAAWGDLDHTLRTGTSAFEHAVGRTLWDSVDTDSALAESFGEAMRRNTTRVVEQLLPLCDLDGVRVVADVGGGDGSLAAGFLAAVPGLRGVVVDRAAMIEVARTSPSTRPVLDRLEFVVADVAEQLPVRADLFVLKSVLHNWSDPVAVRMLRSCAASMRRGDRLCIVERVRSASGSDDVRACLRDLDMHVLFGSGDRTLEHYRRFATEAGLTVRSVAEAEGSLGVVTCVLA